MFADKVGVAKRDNVIDLGLLEFCVREDLNKRARRRMAVLDPIRVVITNYPEEKTETVDCINNPEDETAGKRKFRSGGRSILSATILWKILPRNITVSLRAAKCGSGTPI